MRLGRFGFFAPNGSAKNKRAELDVVPNIGRELTIQFENS